MPSSTQQHILVIKLGALGDVVNTFGAFAHIRAAHPDARITALTTPPFETLLAASPYFDAVNPSGRPRNLPDRMRLIGDLRRARFSRVYDLQCSRRTDRLLYALGPFPPAWSGSAWGASLRHANPRRNLIHIIDARADQLKYAGIWPDPPSDRGEAAPPDLAWLGADIAGLALPDRFVLLAPGCSPHLPHKRWPPESYAELGRRLRNSGLEVVLAGTKADRPVIERIQALLPEAVDLAGRTSLFQLASVARLAQGMVGNDSGPVFLCAAVGAPTLMLMSHHTDPVRFSPRGASTGWLTREDLADLDVDTVEASLRLREG
jgi:ADP-heptose:LPS heptosyltransferase